MTTTTSTTGTTLGLVAVALLALSQATASLQLPVTADALTLGARLTQAFRGLVALSGEKHATLAAIEEHIDDLVDDVHAKGPAYQQCSLALENAKELAFEVAYTELDACNRTAAATLSALRDAAAAQTGCARDDIDCVLEPGKVWLGELEPGALAGRLASLFDGAQMCMTRAVGVVDAAVTALTDDILRCDVETTKTVAVAPQPMQRSWIKKNKKKIMNVGATVCIKYCYAAAMAG